MWNGFVCSLFITMGYLTENVGSAMVPPSSSQLNILDTLSERGLTEFHRLLNGSFALRGLLSSPSLALTLFVPTNEAMDRWRRLNAHTASITSDILQNHIVPGSWSEDQLRQIAQRPIKAQRILSSGFFNSPLWLRLDDNSKKDSSSLNNRTKSPVLYINGALLLSPRNTQLDSRSSSSLSSPHIHLLDDVLAPAGSEATAAAFLQDSSLYNHPQLQLQEIGRRIQEWSNQVPEFQDSSAVYTFFLPVNQAFNLLRNPDSFNVNVLRSHVIPNELLFLRTDFNNSKDEMTERLFPSNGNVQIGFFDNGTTRQVFSNVAQKDNTRFRPGKVYRNLLKSNIPVANGVIHILDGFLLIAEDSAKDIVEKLQGLERFREMVGWLDNPADGSDNIFMELLNEKKDNDKSMTLFVPSNLPLSRLPQEQQWRLRHDRAFLTRILNLHLISNSNYPLLTAEMINGSSVGTAQGQRLTFLKAPKGGKLGLPLVKVDGVESRIIQEDIACSNGVIHVVDSVLGLPFLTVMQILESEPTLSRTFRAINYSKDLKAALSTTGNNVTIFAPSDQAWSNLDQRDLAHLFSHTHLVAKVIQRHVVSGRRLDGKALRREERFTTIPGDIQIKQSYSESDRTTVNPPSIVLSWKGHSASIVTYDIPAVNGLIHVIDQVLFDQDFDITQASTSSSTPLSTSAFLLNINLVILFKIVFVFPFAL